MKTFLIMCVVLVTKIQAEFISPFPKKYDQIVDGCRNETGYTDEVAADEEETYYAENRGLRKLNYCFLEKTGFVTSDGKMNIDNLDKLDPSLFKDIIEHCYDLEKINPKSIFLTCFHAETKYHMRLLVIKYVANVIADHFTQIVEVCRNETGYTDEVLAEEEKSELDKDEGLKKFNDCFLEKIGFRNYEKFEIDSALAKIPESNVTEIVELCQSKTSEKIIPDSIPFFSACMHLGVSDYIRTTGFKLAVQSETDQVLNLVYDCQEETGLTHEVLQKRFTEDNFTNEEELRKFNDCFLEKTGFITSDGKLNIDTALEKLPPSFAKPIVEHCQANIALNYTTESVENFSTCYHDGILNHLSEAERVGYLPFTISWKVFVPGSKTGKFILRDTSSFIVSAIFWWPLLSLALRSCSSLRIVWWVCPKKSTK